MDQMVINAKIRKETGKKAAKQLRATGRLPAVMYNSKGESTMLDIDEVEFNKVWRNITPTTVITLKQLYELSKITAASNRIIRIQIFQALKILIFLIAFADNADLAKS